MIPFNLNIGYRSIFAISSLLCIQFKAELFFQTGHAVAQDLDQSVAHDRSPVIVQLFNWPFSRVEEELPLLKEYGYTHVFVSPANLTIGLSQWWGRYQPIDYRVLGNILGTREEFESLNRKANAIGIDIIADVVLNHMADRAAIDTEYGIGSGSTELSYPPIQVRKKFGLSELFNASHFHFENCIQDWNNREQQLTGWFCDSRSKLPDLDSGSPHVLAAQVEYLNLLTSLGVDGFRLDAVKHIDPFMVGRILSKIDDPGRLRFFGEIVSSATSASRDFSEYLSIDELSFYNYPLLEELTQVLRAESSGFDFFSQINGDSLFLESSRSVTFVVNHDLPGNGEQLKSFKVGRENEGLAYALVFGLGLGTPYVYSDLGPSTESGIDWADYQMFHRTEYLKQMVVFYRAVQNQVSEILYRSPEFIVLQRGHKGIFAMNLGDDEVCVSSKDLRDIDLNGFRDLRLVGFPKEIDSHTHSLCVAGRSTRMLLHEGLPNRAEMSH